MGAEMKAIEKLAKQYVDATAVIGCLEIKLTDRDKLIEELRHQLANHLDDDSTEECPGCYMEKIWEDQIEARNKFIKKLVKLHKNVLENGSSHAFFIMQQAYKSEGELGWDEGKALFDNMIKVAKNIKNLAAKEIK